MATGEYPSGSLTNVPIPTYNKQYCFNTHTRSWVQKSPIPTPVWVMGTHTHNTNLQLGSWLQQFRGKANRSVSSETMMAGMTAVQRERVVTWRRQQRRVQAVTAAWHRRAWRGAEAAMDDRLRGLAARRQRPPWQGGRDAASEKVQGCPLNP